MRLDGRYVAVVDRFEGDQAVLLVERDGEVVDQLVVDGEDLPTDARHRDAVLEVTLDSGVLRNVEYLPEETDQRTTEAQDRFDRLSQRPPGSDDRSDSPESTGSDEDVDSHGDSTGQAEADATDEGTSDDDTC